MGKKFLENLRYNGVAHLDFRRDKRDGQAKLLDFNPRLAGTNDTSLHSGVDFGYLLYRLSLDQQVDPISKCQVGKEFRIIDLEWEHFKTSPHKIKILRDFVNIRNVSTDFLISDPLPHLVWLGREIWRLLNKYFSKLLFIKSRS